MQPSHREYFGLRWERTGVLSAYAGKVSENCQNALEEFVRTLGVVKNRTK